MNSPRHLPWPLYVLMLGGFLLLMGLVLLLDARLMLQDADYAGVLATTPFPTTLGAWLGSSSAAVGQLFLAAMLWGAAAIVHLALILGRFRRIANVV